MLTWAPRVPSRKSRFAKTGSPSRERPMGSRRSILSKKRAWSRSTPAARATSWPGRGGTKTSGSTRVTRTWAACATDAGKHPVFDQEHVRVELGPFVARTNDVDHAEEANDAPVGQRGLDHDHVVELDVLALGDTHPELEGHGVERAQDAAHGLAHADTSRRSQASMARRIRSGSPRSRRRRCSRPPMGTRLLGARGSWAASEARRGRRRQRGVGQGHGLAQGQGAGRLEPHHARQRRLDGPALGEAQVPRIAGGPRVLDQEERGTRAHLEPAQQAGFGRPRGRRRMSRFTRPTIGAVVDPRKREGAVEHDHLGRSAPSVSASRASPSRMARLQPVEGSERRVLGNEPRLEGQRGATSGHGRGRHPARALPHRRRRAGRRARG